MSKSIVILFVAYASATGSRASDSKHTNRRPSGEATKFTYNDEIIRRLCKPLFGEHVLKVASVDFGRASSASEILSRIHVNFLKRRTLTRSRAVLMLSEDD